MRDQAAIIVPVHDYALSAGYRFTVAMVGLDPIAGRPSYRFRIVVSVAALGIRTALARSLYASPAAGVPIDQAGAASKLMCYGGDVIGLALITFLCWQWYRATEPRPGGSLRDTPATAVEAPQGGSA